MKLCDYELSSFRQCPARAHYVYPVVFCVGDAGSGVTLYRYVCADHAPAFAEPWPNPAHKK